MSADSSDVATLFPLSTADIIPSSSSLLLLTDNDPLRRRQRLESHQATMFSDRRRRANGGPEVARAAAWQQQQPFRRRSWQPCPESADRLDCFANFVRLYLTTVRRLHGQETFPPSRKSQRDGILNGGPVTVFGRGRRGGGYPRQQLDLLAALRLLKTSSSFQKRRSTTTHDGVNGMMSPNRRTVVVDFDDSEISDDNCDTDEDEDERRALWSSSINDWKDNINDEVADNRRPAGVGCIRRVTSSSASSTVGGTVLPADVIVAPEQRLAAAAASEADDDSNDVMAVSSSSAVAALKGSPRHRETAASNYAYDDDAELQRESVEAGGSDEGPSENYYDSGVSNDRSDVTVDKPGHEEDDIGEQQQQHEGLGAETSPLINKRFNSNAAVSAANDMCSTTSGKDKIRCYDYYIKNFARLVANSGNKFVGRRR